MNYFQVKNTLKNIFCTTISNPMLFDSAPQLYSKLLDLARLPDHRILGLARLPEPILLDLAFPQDLMLSSVAPQSDPIAFGSGSQTIGFRLVIRFKTFKIFSIFFILILCEKNCY